MSNDIEARKELFRKSNISLNTIYNEDCIEFMKRLPAQSIDLIFADPPYNLSKSSFKIKFSKMRTRGSDLDTYKGRWDFFLNLKEYEDFTKAWLSESFRIMKENGSLWVSGTYHNIYIVGYYLIKIGFELLNEIIWHKTDATPNISCTRFVADHETFIWARRGKKHTFNYEILKKLNNGKQMRCIWSKGKTTGGKKIHPTQKPEWLLERIILSSTNPNEIVFDPFIGSGTTAAVAKLTGRYYLGTEIDPSFYALALKRINTLLDYADEPRQT